MSLPEIWFVAVAVLFVGYFLLEGFDFGVGGLLPVVGRTENDRRVMINTIGPVWDANETWLIVAGAAMFAAFPDWYATLFSGFYLPLLLILLALIARGVAFEYRGKVDDPRWRARWDAAIVAGSLLPALLWGVAFANIVRGVPVDADMTYVGSPLLTLLNPYALLGGLVTLTLFLTHGAVFLAMRTEGPVRVRARAVALRLGPVTALLAVGFLGWTVLDDGGAATAGLAALAALALVGALVATAARREALGFALTAVTVVAAVASLFVALFPAVLPSTLDPAWSLTVDNASSTPYTLTIMTWVTVVMLPVVLLYQAWTYRVFRRRIHPHHIPAAAGLPARRRPETAVPQQRG
ncbi:cytochrome d ubiquinol oxidase subunit II [Aquipuribacter nitratireducens]|uniref:Cytochrome d ubiquinol oxidase subunit II n=1 Tax=Aquipuribacter nitratireducens TaxID=650104 RepID=A0ABW0GRM9_9MICO